MLNANTRCISCDTNDPTVPLYEVFDDIYYCMECIEKYGLKHKVKLNDIDSDMYADKWGVFDAAHK